MTPKIFHLSSLTFLFFYLSCFLNCHAHPLDFLKNLNGTHKGDIAKDLGQLKKHLANLGYINLINSIHINNDIFDHTLEHAIKKYQKFYRIQVTGYLDPQTITSMLEPRCGVADFLTDHHAYMASWPLRNNKYAVSGLLWPPNKRDLTVSFPEGTRQDARGPVEYALSRWASVTNFKFTFIDNFQDADVKVSFQMREHGDYDPFDGPGGILAHSTYPPWGMVHFDSEEDWATYVKTGQYDLQTIALHELGHVLGLAHSDDPDAVMYAISHGERKDLTSDDIKGIQSIYST